MADFDFDDADDTPDEVVRGVAADIRAAALKELTPEEIALREVEREARLELCRQQQEQWRHEIEQKEAARVAQEQAEWLAEHRQLEAIRQRDRAAEIERLTTQRTLSALRLSAARQDTFERDVRTSHANAVRQQNISHILGEINAMANPVPPPEPTVVVVEADPQDDEFCGVKVTGPNPRRSWW